MFKAGQLVLLPSKKNPNVKRWQKPLYFVSGTNRPGEIKGWAAAAGQPIGVAVPEVTPATLQALARLRRNHHVFVDSGAFKEVDADLNVVNPMTPKHWDKVFKVYRAVADMNVRAHLVAPDQVGNQDVTLERMRSMRDQLWAAVLPRETFHNASEVFVPMQGGKLTAPEFYDAAMEALTPPRIERDMSGKLDPSTGELYSPSTVTVDYPVVPSFPSAKGKTPHSVIVGFAEERQPKRMHLLGLRVEKKESERLAAAIAEVSPDTVLSFDSNFLRSKIGSKGGRGGGPRDFTQARRWAVATLRDRLGRKPPVPLVERLALDTIIGIPDRIRSKQAHLERLREDFGKGSSASRGLARGAPAERTPEENAAMVEADIEGLYDVYERRMGRPLLKGGSLPAYVRFLFRRGP